MKVLELAERRGFMVVIDDVSPAGPVPRAAAWGEILRYGAFCRELGLAEDAGREEFVLAAYRKWGREFPSHLLGEVSYAVWDPTEGVLIAVSDTAGSRPIYYAAKEGKVAVSTDTRALRALPWVGSKVDDLTVVAWLVDGPQREDASFYANIKRLPGGCRLVARNGRVDVRRWWGPFFPADEGIKTQADFIARFRELLFDAVRDRLLLGGPVSILLSGGFDSTAIAGVAAALSREPGIALPEVRTISAMFHGFDCDESERIAIARQALPFLGDTFACEPGPILPSDIADHAALFDAPFVLQQESTLATWSSLANSRGSVALFGGFGGDELVYDLYDPGDVLREFGFGRWPRAVAYVSDVHAIGPLNAMFRVSRAAASASLQGLLRPWRSMKERVASRQVLEPRWWPEARMISVRRRAVSTGLATYTDDVRWAMTSDASAQWRRAWFGQLFLRDGLEVRSPFFDRRLSELVYGTHAAKRPVPEKSAPFKPILVHATRDVVPKTLTAQRWKPFFDTYNDAILHATTPELANEIDNSRDWQATRFLEFQRARALASRSRLTTGPSRRDSGRHVLNVVAVESWLSKLDSNVAIDTTGGRDAGQS